VHATSARAALLVGIGEFVWPGTKQVWSSTLVGFLGELGFEPNAARKAIQRTAKTGIMTPIRDGRRVRWEITPAGERLLSGGGERIYGWERRSRAWDGRWLLLTVTIPETMRQLRHHVQARLEWVGLGSPAPGQWLSPHPDRVSEQIATTIEDLGLSALSHSFIGVHGLGDEERLVRQAWALDELDALYRAFIERFSGIEASDDRAALVARIELVQGWRRFPYIDPDLPARFLPADWPGDEAARVFREGWERLRTPSQRSWRLLAADQRF